MRSFIIGLALARFDFVAAEAFLGFGVPSVNASDWVVFTNTNLFGAVLSVLGSVIGAMTSQFADEADQFALCVLLCHLLTLTFIIAILLILA